MDLKQSLSQIETSLQTLEEPSFDKLDFEWEDISFHAAAREISGQPEVQVTARLGSLYFTIEDPMQRAMAIERLYSANRSIDGAYKIDNKGRVSFESITRTDEKKTGRDLMAATAIILLEAESHLRSLRSHLKPA